VKFLYHKINTLPRLSWYAVMYRSRNVVDVFHGSWVETRDFFFVDGAWEGDFSLGDIDSSYLLMGSGGRVRDEKAVFCTPCHIHERIHVIKTQSQLFVSPSLVFVLKMANRALDIQHIPYQVDLLNMIRIMDNHVGSIPIKDNEAIEIYHFRNIEIDSDLNITVKLKTDPPDFSNFNDYKGFLVKSLDSINKNANDEGRQVKYSLLTTVSSGYDSNVCASIATEIGCREAATFRDARPDKKRALDDSGKEIGEKMGLYVKEYDRLSVLDKEGFPEAEFVACGDLGQDFHFSAFEGKLQKKIFIVGYHGDTMWNRHNMNPVKDIIRPSAAGSCLIEFKSRVGFIYVPLAYFGCLSLPSIYKISNSEEMKRWSVNSHYDRPIARRIVEEKGIPRHLFGQIKKATTVLLNRHRSVLSRMNPQSAESFEQFYQKNRKKRKKSNQAFYDFMFFLYSMYQFIFGKLNRIFRRFHLRLKVPDIIPDKFSQCPGRPSFLVHWGISEIEHRYEILDENKSEQRKL